jgi:dethiobiotin synthetase
MSAVRSLFLVGTDTGIGKTTIAEGLLRLAARRRLRITPFKPTESGIDQDPGASDAARLLRASERQDLPLSSIAPYRLVRPLAPGLAARLESRVIPEHRLVRHARRLLDSSAALIIETAGGLLSPYGAGQTPASLARAMSVHIDIDVLLVSANRLGAINQCALACVALERHAIPCAGIVLVDLAPGETTAQKFNPGEIAAATSSPVLGQLRFLTLLPPSADQIADALLQDVDVASLFSGALIDRARQSSGGAS